MRNLCLVGFASFVFVGFFAVASFLADLVFALYTIYSDGLPLLLLFLDLHIYILGSALAQISFPFTPALQVSIDRLTDFSPILQSQICSTSCLDSRRATRRSTIRPHPPIDWIDILSTYIDALFLLLLGLSTGSDAL